MINDHGLGAPLGLGAFAGVIDDKGVDMRHRPQNSFGQAFLAQRQSFTGQPFQIAMFAQMHNRMRALAVAQPKIEGQIVMRWHKVWRVIGLCGINVIPPRRLQAQADIAEPQDGQFKASLSSRGCGLKEGICTWIPPPLFDPCAQGIRQRLILRQIVDQRQGFSTAALSAICQPIGRTGHDLRHQRRAVCRQRLHIITSLSQKCHRMHG